MASVERHGSGGPYEAIVGYSRVVRAGSLVEVAGCTAIGEDGEVLGVGDPPAQTRHALANGEVFAAIRPVTTMVEVSALVDPRLLVEIEATAYRP